jgi:Flp pilus assembly secretin CpaC
MRPLLLILLFSLSATLAPAQKPHSSKKDRKAAEQEFQRALELQKSGKVEDALLAASHAAELAPGNPVYLTARETLRQQLVGRHLERGNHIAEAGNNAGAAEEFRQALAIDPENAYLVQRLRDVSVPDDPDHRRIVQLLASVDQINLEPKPGKASIHVRGDARALYTQIGTAFGVTMQFDQGLNSRPVLFDLDDVDFYTAAALAGKMTKTFWAPVTQHEAIVANDTQELRRQYERLSLRTFYIGNATSSSDLTDIANVLRNIFEISMVSVEPGHNTITVKAPRASVEAAESVIENLMEARPEIMLDVQAMEFDTNKATQFGVNLPNSFTVFNIPSEIRRVLGADAQPVIDAILKNGTIDPSKIPAADLANLQGSPLLSPFVIFGKGPLGLTGVSTPPISGTLSFNSSYARALEHMTLRATDGESATFRRGDRYPILISSFSTVAFSTRGSAAVGNTPQFQYYDLGVTLKMKPHYQSSGEVRLDLELEIVGLGTGTLNNIPELTTRSFKANITVREGEPTVVMGEINEQELRATSGYPGLGQIPVVRGIVNTHSNQRVHNEILIVITPQVVRKPFRDKGTSVVWSR